MLKTCSLDPIPNPSLSLCQEARGSGCGHKYIQREDQSPGRKELVMAELGGMDCSNARCAWVICKGRALSTGADGLISHVARPPRAALQDHCTAIA